MQYAGVDMFRTCGECKRIFSGQRTAKYCCDACRQTAYRKRKNPMSGSRVNLKERALQAADTKRNTFVKCVCQYCGKERAFDAGAAAGRKYCSDACKQAAYRKRNRVTCP